jgi:hypothetical protein
MNRIVFWFSAAQKTKKPVARTIESPGVIIDFKMHKQGLWAVLTGKVKTNFTLNQISTNFKDFSKPQFCTLCEHKYHQLRSSIQQQDKSKLLELATPQLTELIRRHLKS